MDNREPIDPNIMIDEMRAIDAPQVVALELACGLNSRGLSGYLHDLTKSVAFLYVAIDKRAASENRTIVGIFSAALVIDELQIDNIAVAPAWRRRGIATLMLRRSLQIAYQKGARKAVLEVRSTNHAARSLYQKFGFKIAGMRPDYYRDPLDHALTMTCLIESWIGL